MLEQISWGDYMTATGVALSCYYAAVGLGFYRQEIRDFVVARKNAAAPGSKTTTGTGTTGKEIFLFESPETLLRDIDSILAAAGKQASKQQLLPQIQQRLASYTGLREPAYRNAVFNHIIQQSEKLCGLRISVQDLA